MSIIYSTLIYSKYKIFIIFKKYYFIKKKKKNIFAHGETF